MADALFYACEASIVWSLGYALARDWLTERQPHVVLLQFYILNAETPHG